MKLKYLKRIPVVAVLPLIFSGCADFGVLQPSEVTAVFYYLDSPMDTAQAEALQSDGIAVLVGPTSIAKYLDQPQIATWSNPNQLTFSETQRWAEPLEENINRVLIDHLSMELGSSQVGFLRVMSDIEWDYRVGYHIYQLIGTPGDKVHLQASWWVVSKDGETRRFDGSVFEEPVAGDYGDYPAYVRAIESLIGKWSKEVSVKIQEMDN